MASIAIVLNTDTRESALTINGEPVLSNSLFFSKGTDFEGIPFLRFSYTVEKKNSDGLVEIREFFLSDPQDDAVADVLANGLCCTKSKGLTQAQIDIISFMKKKQ